MLLTPGCWPRGRRSRAACPREALSPSVDGPLVGVDDLIGATYFALCDDGVRGLLDVTLPRAGATAALPPSAARWVDELRVLKLLRPDGRVGHPHHQLGFRPLNPTLAETVAGRDRLAA